MELHCFSDVRLPVYILVVVFGMGSWITVNGLFVELPILVNKLPEGWTLPSYFTILIQIANIGPLLYVVINKLAPKHFNEVHAVFIIMSMGAIACFTLVFIWEETLNIAGAERSIGLLSCVFLMSFVDCTSTVVFLAYMANLKPGYISALYIGNGLCGLVPGILALVQNAGDIKCVNRTIDFSRNLTGVIAEYSKPTFSAEVFFGVLSILVAVCGVAFSLIHYLPYCKHEHITVKKSRTSSENGL